MVVLTQTFKIWSIARTENMIASAFFNWVQNKRGQKFGLLFLICSAKLALRVLRFDAQGGMRHNPQSFFRNQFAGNSTDSVSPVFNAD
tara:strand:+ start:1154 stop:1417 length:264 start_codon:yes stop_codon:yes gene_type:complete